jgi:hypothetical protein
MNDMQGIGKQGIAHFLEIAGGKSWEFGTFLANGGFLVFKRPS